MVVAPLDVVDLDGEREAAADTAVLADDVAGEDTATSAPPVRRQSGAPGAVSPRHLRVIRAGLEVWAAGLPARLGGAHYCNPLLLRLPRIMRSTCSSVGSLR